MYLFENGLPVETSLESKTSVHFAFLEHLGSDFDKVKGLSLTIRMILDKLGGLLTYSSVSYQGKYVSRYKSLFVHPLVPVAPVFDYRQDTHINKL